MMRVFRMGLVIWFCLAALPTVPTAAQDVGATGGDGLSAEQKENGKWLYENLVKLREKYGAKEAAREYDRMKPAEQAQVRWAGRLDRIKLKLGEPDRIRRNESTDVSAEQSQVECREAPGKAIGVSPAGIVIFSCTQIITWC